MDAAIAALIGAGIGAAAGIAGQLVTASYTSRNERRRSAVDAAIREWELMTKSVGDRGGSVYPSAYFVYFMMEVIRLVDSRGGLTAERYRDLVSRAEVLRQAIEEESERRKRKP